MVAQKTILERRYYSVRELSLYLGISQAGIRKWIRCRCIPFQKINGTIRFDIEQINEWIQKGR